MRKLLEEKLIEKIAQKYSLELILLFGSKISGKAHRESDFDVAYLSNKALDLEEEARLIMELSQVFKSENIDLVNLKKAPPLLMKQIFQNHRVLYCSNFKIYHLYKIYALKRFIEAAPLFRLRDELIEKYFMKT